MLVNKHIHGLMLKVSLETDIFIGFITVELFLGNRLIFLSYQNKIFIYIYYEIIRSDISD